MNCPPAGFVVASAIVLLGIPAEASANRESEALRARAANEFYNLDHDQALGTYRRAVAADPQDAGAYRGLAGTLWLSITYRRGNMTVDDYIGRVSRPNSSTAPPPPPETAAAFRDAMERALALSRQRIEANPRDADAHYQLGAAVGLRASYIATVENSAVGAFRAAREAYDEHEKVLDLDPRRKDAGLVVGTYRYRIGAGAALAMGRICGRVRRRPRKGAAAGRRRRGVFKWKPDRRALCAGPHVQPREAIRRRADAARHSARAVPAQSPGVARNRIDQPPRGSTG